MKATIVFSALLVVLLSIVSTDANAHGRRCHPRYCAPRYYTERVYVAPQPVYYQAPAPVVYYNGPRYCPPPRYYARAYYGRPRHYRHCR